MKKLPVIIFAIVALISIILFIVFNFVISKKRYKNYVLKYAEEFDVEPALVYAIIKVESNWAYADNTSYGEVGCFRARGSL